MCTGFNQQKQGGRSYWNWNTLMAFLLLTGGLAITAWAAEGGDGDQDCDPPDVPVRGTLSATNNDPQGRTANDFHFYMYQNDRDSVQVTGATVSSSNFGAVGVTLGTDDGTGDPPPGNHGAQVDCTGGEVAAGERVNIDIQVCMNERNCLKFKDFVWTYDDQPDPTPRPVGGGGGWRIGRPYSGGNGGNISDPSGGGHGAQQGSGGSGNYVHLVSFENDHPTLCMEILELKLLASMTLYANPQDISEGGDIDWSAIAPVKDSMGRPPVIVYPGQYWCFPFQTTGSYLGGHVYSNFKARWITCPKKDGDVKEEEGADTEQIGDHPVDAEAIDGDLDGLYEPFEYIYGLDDDDDGSVDPNNGAAGDPDNDTLTNIQEFDLLTNPMDSSSPGARDIVPPGVTPFVDLTPLNIDVGTDGAPVPPEFFGPGSDPFSGLISFVFEPLVFYPGCPDIGPANVILSHLDPFALVHVGDSTVIRAELSAFLMKSNEPAHITFNGGAVDSFFDVFVEIETFVSGEMIIQKEHGNGGTLSGTFPFMPRFRFVKIADPTEEHVFPAYEFGYSSILTLDYAPWVHYNAAYDCTGCSERFMLNVAESPYPELALFSADYTLHLEGLCSFVTAAEQELGAGFDYFVTPKAEVNFGYGYPPIPADFFEPGSEPFFGTVSLTGVPFGSSTHCSADPGPADTLLRRGGPAHISEGLPDIVDIELVELNLESTEPITVGTQMYDVKVTLITTSYSSGSAFLIPIDPSWIAGQFDVTLQPSFQFTQVDAPPGTPPKVLEDSWYITDIQITEGIEAPVFADGFECGTTCAWSMVPPKGIVPPFRLKGNGISLWMQGFPPQAQPGLDFGDAPEPFYPTLLASDGARHMVVPGMFLGTNVDVELDGLPHPAALGDDETSLDDEDGVIFTASLYPNADATVDVFASAPGMLNAWVDFDIDGTWTRADEHVFTDMPLVPGLNSLVFTVPSDATTGLSYARFRYNTVGGLSFTGEADDGEVEDYAIEILASEGEIEGAVEGEGGVEGEIEGTVEGEGVIEGEIEGTVEGEGVIEGEIEGTVEGEGVIEGEIEGTVEGEGVIEGEIEGTVEGEGIVEGEIEGTVEGEGVIEGEIEGTVEGEGVVEGEIEGTVEGEGVVEGEIEGTAEGEGEGSIEENEAAARDTLCLIWAAQNAYYIAQGEYATNFDALTTAVPPYLVWDGPTSHGFTFWVSANSGPPASFNAGASPIEFGVTANNSYFIDETGLIRYEEGGEASPSSPLYPGGNCAAEGEGQTEGEDGILTADQNGDNLISLSELLRVIQFFNSGGFHCQDGTEDGYAPGPGDQSCAPYDSDYNPLDWEISLSELLRVIQFFNSGGYHYCPGEGTEDGFCPGAIG